MLALFEAYKKIMSPISSKNMWDQDNDQPILDLTKTAN